MYAWIVQYRSRRLFSPDGVERVRAEFLPLRSEAPGFLGFHLVQISETEGFAMSLWDSEEAMQAGSRHTAAWVQENVLPYVDAPPESVVGRVVATTAVDG